jgi:3-methyladenine DNA glycosylase/8-oxoguanine DNA glycosylase
VISQISLPSDFSFDSVVRSHGWYDLPPFAYDRDSGALATSVVVGSRAVPVVFRSRGGRLEAASASPMPAPALRGLARRVFSLDRDLSDAALQMRSDPHLQRALRRGRGRMLRAPTVFEDAVKMLFTTNCTWAATRGMVVRLIGLAGAEGAAFPDARAVARLTPSRLREKVRCGYRAEALSRFARRVDSGRLDLSAWETGTLSSEELRSAILSEHGFGPYAAEGLLRILGRHDYFAIDSWIRQQYRRLYPGAPKSTDRSIARRYARYGSHRGLALWLDMTRGWHEGDGDNWP